MSQRTHYSLAMNQLVDQALPRSRRGLCGESDELSASMSTSAAPTYATGLLEEKPRPPQRWWNSLREWGWIVLDFAGVCQYFSVAEREEVIDAFLDEVQVRRRNILLAHRWWDRHDLRHHVHAMKSASACIGATLLAEISGYVESMIDTGRDMESIRLSLLALDRAIESTVDAIKMFRTLELE